MKPQEVYDLTLHEVNLYLEGCNERLLREQEDILRVSYYTASFNNSKRLKPLSTMIDSLRKAFGKKPINHEKNSNEDVTGTKSRLLDYWSNTEK